MPKNVKSLKNSERNTESVKKRDLVLKMDGTIYGKAVKLLGDCNFTIQCYDGVERLCHLRKKIKRDERIQLGSIVLVGLRDYQDSKGDIIFVYTREDEMELRKMEEIPSDSKDDLGNEEDDMGDDKGSFNFEDI
jgi:translation initiation factor 1A